MRSTIREDAVKVGIVSSSIMMRKARLAGIVVWCDVLERHLSEKMQREVRT